MRRRSTLAAMLLLLPLVVAGSAQGPDQPVVDSAWVDVSDAVLRVNARVAYPADDRMRAALEAGATVQFDLQVRVARESRYWFDTDVVEATLRRSLSWNALTRRFELEDDTGLRSIDTLEEALATAGEVLDWPVELSEPLEEDASYRVRVRAVDRRGSLASSLKALLPWSEGGPRHSEWSTWTLPR